MTTDLTARYEGRPMIRVLDAWFLDALGALDENAATSMEQLAPRLAQTFNVTPGPWHGGEDIRIEQSGVDTCASRS